jgi:hypothetical protein
VLEAVPTGECTLLTHPGRGIEGYRSVEPDTRPPPGDSRRSAFRPIAMSTVAIRNVRFTSKAVKLIEF